MKAARIKIYFDGGARPNPGAMEFAVVMRGTVYVERDVGTGSSLDAEWRAAIAALQLAQAQGATDFILLGDSMTVVNQANGRVRAQGNSAAHLMRFRALAGDTAVRVRHVKRTQNLAGIALARCVSMPPRN